MRVPLYNVGMHKTFRFRVKNMEGELNRQARACNVVWNFCNDTQKQALKWNKHWPTAFDLINLTVGACFELKLGSSTINEVCKQYAQSRSQHRKPYLRWRGKRSLGWIPVRATSLSVKLDGFKFAKTLFRVFNMRDLRSLKICDGSSFSQDAKGNWYLNIVCEVPAAEAIIIRRSVGIDLGLKDFATLSNGEKVEAPRYYRAIQTRLAVAQRARKRRQVTNLHAKVANARKDFLHKVSHRIVGQFDYIAVGNVSAAGLAKTRLAKSVLDASWSNFRRMLAYKSIASGKTFAEVSERFTTQICHACGCIAGPKGPAGLNKRNWDCVHCGAVHDRDVNAALNILFRGLGHQAPVEGIAA